MTEQVNRSPGQPTHHLALRTLHSSVLWVLYGGSTACKIATLCATQMGTLKIKSQSNSQPTVRVGFLVNCLMPRSAGPFRSCWHSCIHYIPTQRNDELSEGSSSPRVSNCLYFRSHAMALEAVYRPRKSALRLGQYHSLSLELTKTSRLFQIAYENSCPRTSVSHTHYPSRMKIKK